jgi:hypothetical protein
MIEFVGPNYQYQGEQLNQPEFIIVRDHHYDEELQCFPVESLLRHSLCNPKDHVVIFDHVLQHDDVLTPYNLCYFPSFLARENREFIAQQIQPDWSNKTHAFNFMINKSRRHRERLLQLVTQFDLQSYRHTLAWTHNNINAIAVTDYKFGTEHTMEKGLRSGAVLNSKNYQGLLQRSVFEPTCVSLITEPAYYERETIVTEKTMMAMYGGTVPIWVGGWRIADYLRNTGFDVFDDIIDHSYQSLPDPADRVDQALQLNIDLLRDPAQMQKFCRENANRFQHNVDLLQSNIFTELCQQQIDQCSGELQLHLTRLLG